MDIMLGIASDEAVLRGGCLKQPTIIAGLSWEGGKRFVHLFKGSEIWCQFLTGASKSRRLLSQSDTIERLVQAKDAMYDASLACFMTSAEQPDVDNDGDANKDDLELPSESSVLSPSKVARAKKKFKPQMPTMFQLDVAGPGGSPWQPWVMAMRKKFVMEFTSYNMTILYELVQADLLEGNKKRLANGSDRPPDAIKQPRVLDDGKREYWQHGRQRWLQKNPAGTSPEAVAAEKTGDLEYDDDIPDNNVAKLPRTLVRQPSDVPSDLRRGRGRPRSSAPSVMPVAPAPLTDAQPPEYDELGL